MTIASSHPASPRALWLPPARMRQYAVARIVGGVLFAMIFAGWMALQWSNVSMRLAAGGLIILTAWITAVSVRTDARRMQGRQVERIGDDLLITLPRSETQLRLDDVSYARWSLAADDFGLSFYDRNDSRLARLDEDILADETEARAFLRWLRTHGETRFEVKWN